MNESALNNPALNSPALNNTSLELRDIHLPEPISWWPVAPGWWILAASILLIIIVFFIIRKIYSSRQLKREISSELEKIKQQFQETQNKSQLAKSLSILLRRASITYYPANNIAGLTGSDWLLYLDTTKKNSSGSKKFQSDTGRILLHAPYLPDDTKLDFDAPVLISLCESWLTSPHNKTIGVHPS